MITEDMLRKAAERACDEFTAQLEEGYDPQHPHEFSPEFQSRVEQLSHRAAHPFLHTALKRVAAVFLAVLLGSSAWLATDAEVRSAFIGWVTETSGNLFAYRYEGESFYEPAEYRLGYIPEGYTEHLSDIDETGGFVIYSNSDDDYLSLVYVISTGEGDAFFLDNRDTTQFSIKVNGMTGQYFHTENDETSDSIVWINEQGHLLNVDGFFDKDELLRIAESVEKIN